jgi:2-polyprenyl-3-methyl-5-hydroxy-6-metoxy-1,4-benzoquinol methylase
MSRLDTSKRTSQREILDDFDLKGEELEETLSDLDTINKWLGGNDITINGLKTLLKDLPKEKVYYIGDLGCGSGQVLREIADWGKANNYTFKLIGIDANQYAIAYAEQISLDYPEISYSTEDIFSYSFEKNKFDIVLCTLTLHHFSNEDILKLLVNLKKKTKLGIIVNDLHRSKIAYRLFQAYCAVFINNEIARKDGLISILRGFKKKDLEELASHLPQYQHSISWKWAFRYQWILEKKNI